MMKKILFVCCAILLVSQTFGQAALNMTKLGELSYPNDNLNDIWGYAANNREFALVGAKKSFSIVEVTNPSAPVEIVNIPGATSVWRDIKTYSHYAYVVHDSYTAGSSDGIMIVDMDSVLAGTASPTVYHFFPQIDVNGNTVIYDRAHNIYIDENGVLYVFGSNIGIGGALMFDLTISPEAPVYLGMYNAAYLHDGMARGDTLWGSAIYAGQLQAIDVKYKNTPVLMGGASTPSTFAHNCWVSDDGKTVFTTDEISGAYVASYDVTDLSNIKELDRIQTSFGIDVIPHNTHVRGDFLVNSYYTSGIQVVDITKPNIMIETAYYDTSPLTGDGFNGSWGAYPYLPSGYVLASDIEEGLVVLECDYVKGSYFSGLVKDSITKNSIPNAKIKLSNDALTYTDSFETNLYGEFATGMNEDSTFNVIVSKTGYFTDTIQVKLTRGVELVKEIALLPLNFSVAESSLYEFSLKPNPANNFIDISFGNYKGSKRLEIYALNGQLLLQEILSNAQTSERISIDLKPGIYMVHINAEEIEFKPEKLVITQ